MRVLLGVWMLWMGFAWAEGYEGSVNVVYHVNEAKDPFVIMRNIRNHLNADKNAHIVVVTHGPGIGFLLKDAKDDKGNPYEPEIQNLTLDGVEFRVCANTLRLRKLEDSAVSEEAQIVPSGVAEVARLQQKGYVYLKP